MTGKSHRTAAGHVRRGDVVLTKKAKPAAKTGRRAALRITGLISGDRDLSVRAKDIVRGNSAAV